MSLVAYDSSDDDSDREEPDPSVPKGVKCDEEAPVTLKSVEKPCGLNNLIHVKRNNRGTIQILAPSLAEIEASSSSSDDEEDGHHQRRVKRSRGSSSIGSGLSAILPPVKSSRCAVSFTPSPSNLQLVPQSVKNKKAILPPPKGSIKKDEQEDEEFSGPFFSLESSRDTDHQRPDDMRKISVELAPKVVREEIREETSSTTGESMPCGSKGGMSEEQRLKKMISQRFGGEDRPEDIQLMDVNVNDHLNQNRDYLKTISQEQEAPVAGETPNPTARRKHQITYLAFQAKQRELALKNEWASNRINKNQTRAKYGF